jgi:hypothetical protein
LRAVVGPDTGFDVGHCRGWLTDWWVRPLLSECVCVSQAIPKTKGRVFAQRFCVRDPYLG